MSADMHAGEEGVGEHQKQTWSNFADVVRNMHVAYPSNCQNGGGANRRILGGNIMWYGSRNHSTLEYPAIDLRSPQDTALHRV